MCSESTEESEFGNGNVGILAGAAGRGVELTWQNLAATANILEDSKSYARSHLGACSTTHRLSRKPGKTNQRGSSKRRLGFDRRSTKHSLQCSAYRKHGKIVFFLVVAPKTRPPVQAVPNAKMSHCKS